MTGDEPSDEVLLTAGGWAEVASARVLAKATRGGVCVVVLDANGGQGAQPYETIEVYLAGADGCWSCSNASGPAGSSGGGWTSGYAYTYGKSEDSPTGWWVALTEADEPEDWA